MSKTQRTITAALWGLVVVSLLSLLAMQQWHARTVAKRDAFDERLKAGEIFEIVGEGQPVPATQSAGPYIFEAPTFKLTDQESQPFDSDQLLGKVYTVSFFFSQCQGVCPGMLSRIKALERVTDDPNVHFVYLTVDPANDTPERLREYGQAIQADPKRWHLLTGADAEMKRIAMGFKLPYSTPSEHSGKIMLVNQQGKVQKYYESKDSTAMQQLAADVKKLAAGEAIQ